jgi:hypothetical protein
MKPIRIPSKRESSYLAGKQIYADGPMLPAALFKLVDFGPRPSDRQESLDRAVRAGWLDLLADGSVDLTEASCNYYDKEAPANKPQGSMATPREVKPFRPMSPQYRVNSRGLRADAPDCSVKAIPSHYAKVTP